ncbi:phage tail protein [Lelliottia sp. WB101]|uniref:tail fiber assembly protein n=1 Tax=Lelliottia sp. WB101 TaxID=2153385 RepID=UPI000D20D319|nr:tail fiber assembly protein [Lelliottia sp. WB101]AVY98024.1 phage tail protein [Lelliottia sp. WB101]
MTIFYSAATNGFYPYSAKASYEQAGCWPHDGVEVSEGWYNYLINNQGNGKEITPDEYGRPVLKSISVPTAEELMSIAEEKKLALMKTASQKIAPLQDAADLEVATDAESALLMAWKKYRVMLNRVDLSRPVWPEVPSDVA